MVALQILHDLDQSLLHAKNKKNISICTVYYTQRHGFPQTPKIGYSMFPSSCFDPSPLQVHSVGLK
jgi:hypothetical protein